MHCCANERVSTHRNFPRDILVGCDYITSCFRCTFASFSTFHSFLSFFLSPPLSPKWFEGSERLLARVIINFRLIKRRTLFRWRMVIVEDFRKFVQRSPSKPINQLGTQLVRMTLRPLDNRHSAYSSMRSAYSLRCATALAFLSATPTIERTPRKKAH